LNTSNPRTEVTQTSIYRIPTYPTSEVTERHNFGLLRSDSDHDNTESILRRSEDKRDENLSEEPILLPTYLRNKTEQQSGSAEHGSDEIDSTTSNIGLLDGLKQSFRQESSSVNNYTDDGDNKQTVSSNIKRDVEFLESLQEELEEEQNKSDEQQDQAHSTIAQTAAENLEENFTEQRYSFGAIQEAPENSANEESSSGARFVPLPQDLLMAKSALRHVSDTAKESTTDSIVGGSSGATYT
uniref:Osteopontin n=1 Tax=Anisakis simplex TaxID=6269 RepID=A0A0M3JIF7_ANISI